MNVVKKGTCSGGVGSKKSSNRLKSANLAIGAAFSGYSNVANFHHLEGWPEAAG